MLSLNRGYYKIQQSFLSQASIINGIYIRQYVNSSLQTLTSKDWRSWETLQCAPDDCCASGSKVKKKK